MSKRGGMRVLLGDETSIGLAYALSHHAPGGALPGLFEVNSSDPAQAVLTRFGLDAVELFVRTANDAHLADIERRLPALVTAGARFVLTGKAPTIQRLRRSLRAAGAATSELITKPYWAPGKTGLD